MHIQRMSWGDLTMSYRREVTIWCDNCAAWERTQAISAKAARQAMRRQGWRCAPLPSKLREEGWQDLCPYCARIADQADPPPE
jgi:hypothetical protein